MIVAAIVTTAAGILLAAFLTHAPGLWRDEVSSVHTQQSPTFQEMWRRAEFESFPALWMVLLRSWLAIGGGASDATLRLFGLIGPLALLGGAWFAAWRLGGWAPTLSLALLVANPEILRWSATLRPWGLGAGLALAAAALMWDAVARPTRRRVVVAGAVALLSVHTLFQNAVFLAAAGAGCAAVAARAREWRRLAIPAGIGGICALSLLPYVGIIQRRGSWNELGVGPITFGDLADVMSATLSNPGTTAWLLWMVLAAGGLVAAAISWRRSEDPEVDRRRTVAIFAVVTAVVALAGIFALYRQLGYPTQSWYYLGAIAVTAVGAEAAIRSIAAARIATGVLTVAVAALAVTGGGHAWARMRERQTNLDAIAARLEIEAGREDVVLTCPWYIAVPLSRYYGGGARIITVPPIEDQTISRYDLLKERMLDEHAMAPVLEAVDRALSSGRRVWIVGGFIRPANMTIPDSLPPAPSPETGWNSFPYEVVWSAQLARHLQSKTAKCNTIDIGVVGGPLENPHLIVCSGWKPGPEPRPTK